MIINFRLKSEWQKEELFIIMRNLSFCRNIFTSNLLQRYWRASLCGKVLMILYRIHQVRSYGSNLAVNVWWHHYLKEDIDFGECNDACDPALTLNDAVFEHKDGGTMPPEEVRYVLGYVLTL